MKRAVVLFATPRALLSALALALAPALVLPLAPAPASAQALPLARALAPAPALATALALAPGLAQGAARANAASPSSTSLAQWKSGNLPAARASVEAALDTGPVTSSLAEQYAALLEAGGDTPKAIEWLGQALTRTRDPKVQAELRLRLAFAQVTPDNVHQLVELARNREPEFRHRAAIALALLGHFDEAIDLYVIRGDAVARFHQNLRLTQWSLQAGRPAAAQECAWHAVGLGPNERDRRYALSLLVEAHDADKSLDRLLQKFAAKSVLSAEEQEVRVELLRRLGHFDEAIVLFKEAKVGALTAESRRALLRMYSDAGREADMVAEYRRLIAAEPGQLVWIEGLTQHLIEKKETDAARDLWRQFIDRTDQAPVLFSGARALARFGLDDLADAAIEKCLSGDPARVMETRLFQLDRARARGDSQKVDQTLAALDAALPANDTRRIELAYAYERVKKSDEALHVLEALAKQSPNGLGRDERMRLAWLYDGAGRRDEALAEWKALWESSDSEVSRRMIEDRLVALAAETGALGDLVVELESRLAGHQARKKDTALLIRIYTEAEDSASAVEVIQEYFGASGGSRGGAAGRTKETDIASLQEQARVYRALNEGKAYRNVTLRLLALDPPNRVDYLRGLVLSRVESATAAAEDPDGSRLRDWLKQLRAAMPGGANAEFEAGVLMLAGLNDQAIDTFKRAIALNPTHSDNYLLLADLLKQSSREAEAVAMLQYLVEHATDDDAFVVGVDGLLNLQLRDPNINTWTRRRVLERLAAQDDKPYLYELLAELAEEARDSQLYFASLEESLIYAEGRRSNTLRELILASSEQGRAQFRDPDLERALRYSRRIIALGEDLPPEVYVNMGNLFLKSNDVAGATRAFDLAADRADAFTRKN